ncbi:MAG: hypothetical protein IPK87_06000 [Planctomycetes bacterium]|nr:hypothetical protein [Planctomycetota bacterium]
MALGELELRDGELEREEDEEGAREELEPAERLLDPLERELPEMRDELEPPELALELPPELPPELLPELPPREMRCASTSIVGAANAITAKARMPLNINLRRLNMGTLSRSIQRPQRKKGHPA